MKKISSLSNSAIAEYQKNRDVKKFYSFMHNNLSKLWINEKDLRTKLLLEKNYMFYALGTDKPTSHYLKIFLKELEKNHHFGKRNINTLYLL